jgi:PHP family Zn ribbon phosphoesterase
LHAVASREVAGAFAPFLLISAAHAWPGRIPALHLRVAHCCMKIEEVIRTINQMKADGIIANYGIAG